MNFLLQAVASFLAMITFMVILNVPRKLLVPGGLLGTFVWLLYLLLQGPTNPLIATFLAAVIGSMISQVMSILLKTPSIIFSLAILAPLVPGYRSYMTTTYFVSGDYAQTLA
ncbi:TPA: threonine/serine exporter family protein, partial [Streptococcus suis]